MNKTSRVTLIFANNEENALDICQQLGVEGQELEAFLKAHHVPKDLSSRIPQVLLLLRNTRNTVLYTTDFLPMYETQPLHFYFQVKRLPETITFLVDELWYTKSDGFVYSTRDVNGKLNPLKLKNESRLSPPRIVSAANRLVRKTEGGQEEDIIVAGARHHDSVMNPVLKQLYELGYERPDERQSHQGFIDQHGRFYDRHAAWAIAYANNQIVKRCGGDGPESFGLFSENLY